MHAKFMTTKQGKYTRAINPKWEWNNPDLVTVDDQNRESYEGERSLDAFFLFALLLSPFYPSCQQLAAKYYYYDDDDNRNSVMFVLSTCFNKNMDHYNSSSSSSTIIFACLFSHSFFVKERGERERDRE